MVVIVLVCICVHVLVGIAFFLLFFFMCLLLVLLGPDRRPSGGPAGRQGSGLITLGAWSHNPN